MEEQALRRIHQRLLVVITASFALTPIIGYSTAWFFTMVQADQLISARATLLLSVTTLVLPLALCFYFHRYFRPLREWQLRQHEHAILPESLDQQLKNFSDHYWLFFLLYALLAPTLQHWLGLYPAEQSAFASLSQFILLQLVIAILVGMPGYLYALALIGRLVEHSGFQQVHVRLQTRMLLMGGYIPLLTGTILLKYYWWRTQYLTGEVILIWAALGLFAFALTILSIRSLKQSLQPVQDLISGSGATNYDDMARRLRPRSTDETGYIIQMLGRLFRRLGDQESHVHAIVDHAAEGIIVVNDQHTIETFNPAAEKLFGFNSQEIRGKPLDWLLPDFILPRDEATLPCEELEVEGRHRHGHAIPMSIRISLMHNDGQLYYTCLLADISARKAAEQMRLDAETRYRNLVETAHDLVWTMDLEGRWTYLNDAVSRIYGYQASEMLFRHYHEFQAPESEQRDKMALARIMEGQELLHHETVHLDKDGQRRYISFNAKPQWSEEGEVVSIMGTARDISAQKAFEQELAYQAQHDMLTGLYNRNYFQRELERTLGRIYRSSASCALLYLDLDQFKYINDTLGHAAGDRLLLECSEMLQEHTREADLLARFGGDEFTLLLDDVDPPTAAGVAENIRLLFENYRFMDAGKTFNITGSIGIAMLTHHSLSGDEVLSHADLACNIAKSHGRNCLHLYDPGDKQRDGMAEDMGWASRVRDAFENNHFKLAFQPIVDIQSGLSEDYEVLLRMSLEDGEVILPGGFLPAAERFGLINQVDRWTVRCAMEYLAKLHQKNNGIHFAINLSGRAFEDRELLPLINSLLRETGLRPGALTFEITESAAISNLGEATRFIYQLKDIGCQFALDDFGTGFSSFAYLKHLPVDKLKIDGSFVKGLAGSEIDQAMVRSMNQIAHALGKQTIAEFVEDKTTLALLSEFGVDYAQGHYLGKPRTSIPRQAILSA
ncbi:EAL domain-containing protein [Thiohalophilus thiocyanatoxydans]|uniref:PAS domain S-box-containing protein/diguanylate cyclase (GGDEF)-like protein n=1 Tax=Thiohalophilus thiocyanatoxydans TaxID=381308 RepID=A0A4R8IRX7_9GAMM|nr:EAL domain-containing protein [Thiohalophilus thiocyanatoxydans]TDY03686.1 PAS domain S-box-containing protein/diguanylate cyclase (GGDEF)-like protein [Thiohalophilus thiocyanatoxydans]